MKSINKLEVLLLLCTLLSPTAFGAEKNDSMNSGVDLAMQWKKSLPVDERDSSIGIIGGTEARSLVGMDGKLYAGIGYWSDSQENLVYSHEPQKPFEEGSSGFRGLSAVSIPGENYQQLLVTLEHSPCIIFRINPSTFKSVAEINVSAKLKEQWNTKVGYIIWKQRLQCLIPAFIISTLTLTTLSAKEMGNTQFRQLLIKPWITDPIWCL